MNRLRSNTRRPAQANGNSSWRVMRPPTSDSSLAGLYLSGTKRYAGNGIAVDAAGINVYVVGKLNGGYVAQLDGANGAVNWARTVTGTSADTVATDGLGSAYVTSHATVGASFVSYVTKLDTSGTQKWQDNITTGTPISPAGLTVAGNSVYVGGVGFGTTTAVIGSTNQSWNTKSAMYGYVLKLTGDNVYGWVQLFKNSGSNYEVWSNHVAADNTGNVYAFGEFFNKVNFGSVTLNSGSAGDADFVAKLGPTGNVIWAKQFGPITFGLGYSPNAIAVDGAGAVYLTGTFSGTTSFNPAGGGNLTSAGSNDIFALKLDSNGVYQWALRAGGTGDDRGLGIAVDSFGDVDLTGYIGAGPDTFGDPSHSLTTGTQTAFLWQILQP